MNITAPRGDDLAGMRVVELRALARAAGSRPPPWRPDPGAPTDYPLSPFITITPAAFQLLEQWRAICSTTKRGWVFPGLRGQPLSVRAAQTAISKLAAAVGVDGVSSHSFSRSALTATHQAGLSLREVATISGHASLAALERYLDQDAAREKAEAAKSLLVG